MKRHGRTYRGFEGLYEVCDSGAVRSRDRVTKHTGRSKTPGQMTRRGKVLTPNFDSLGYVHYVLTKGNGARQLWKGHHLVAAAFLGWTKDMPKNGYVVKHVNGIRDDNRLENLKITKR